MKIINKIPFLVGVLLSWSTSGQQLDRQVIATAGLSATSSYTIGEVIVNSSKLQVIAGFQQPEFIEAPALGVKDITRELTVFPVPTRDELTIRGLNFSGNTTKALLYSLEGRKMSVQVESTTNEMKLNLDQLPSGNYFLTLQDPINQTTAKFKILKIKL